MGLEIERRFLVSLCDIPLDLYALPMAKIEQVYLDPLGTTRVRSTIGYVLGGNGDPETYPIDLPDVSGFEMTTKTKVLGEHGNLVRDERDIPLKIDQYRHLSSQHWGDKIEKYRYLYHEGGIVIEIDEYLEQLNGLFTIEVEFGSVEEAQAFLPPKWFGKEVTEDRRYSNFGLAMNGLPSEYRA